MEENSIAERNSPMTILVDKAKRGGVRDSGLELYRIICMVLIVAHHYVVNSGLLELAQAAPLSAQSIFLMLFGGWGKTGINCFVLITGYFMCRSHITLKKFLKLLFEIELYRIIIYLIFLISGYEAFSFTGLVKAFLPVTSVGTGFTSCYLLFFLCIPFLNILVNNMTQRQHVLLLALVLFIYVILGTLPKIVVTMNYVSWFIVLYFIASYVRLYPIELFEDKKIWGLIALGIFIISAVSIVVCAWIGTKIDKTGLEFYFVSDSNKVLAVALGFSSFMFFKNIHFESRCINTIASAMFGVLLIHANSDTMRAWLWGDLLKNTTYFNSQWLYLHAIGCVLAIVIVCASIDLIRQYVLEKPLFRWLDGKYFNKDKGVDKKQS